MRQFYDKFMKSCLGYPLSAIYFARINLTIVIFHNECEAARRYIQEFEFKSDIQNTAIIIMLHFNQ
ncbi:hypothetical protein EAE90_11355 [Photorhabdus caribbeanensis]|nr:hypothetical protein [Photorhabdus caribbeanensis]